MAGNEDKSGSGWTLTNISIQMLDLMLAQAVMHESKKTPTQAQDQTGHIQNIKTLAVAARMVTQAVAGLLRAERLILAVISDQRRDGVRGHAVLSGLSGPMENEGMNEHQDEYGPVPEGPDAFADMPEILERKRAVLYREMAAILAGGGLPGDAERSDASERPGVSLEPDGASASG